MKHAPMPAHARTRTRRPREAKPDHRVATDHSALDAAVIAALELHGPAAPLELLRRVEARSADVVDRVCALVVARRVRVDDRGRFALPGVES